jgi:hypothetical protein
VNATLNNERVSGLPISGGEFPLQWHCVGEDEDVDATREMTCNLTHDRSTSTSKLQRFEGFTAVSVKNVAF